jgi:hypothetical protein
VEDVSHISVTRQWTTGELRIMRDNAQLGAVEVARLLGRSVTSVRKMASRQRVSLRAAGMHRGLVLGQPRGVSLRTDIRDDLVSGRVSASVIAQRMKLDADAELCPACGRRPARVRVTGLCLCCHKALLTEKHHEVLDEIASNREQNRVKQAAKRARDSAMVAP